MVLKHQRCKNIQNVKSNNNRTSQQKLVNNRYIHTYNITSKVTLNNKFGNRERDCSNNTISLNSNISTTLLIYHKNIRQLQNKTDELSMHWSTNFPHVLCFTEHHFHND